MFAAGDIVAGKFQIERVLGRGGMGFVVAATHIHLGQRVALKFLLPEFQSDPAVAGRFVREARAAAQLRGEHVCRVSDVGTLDTGAPYIVMELLEGRDLASMLAEKGPVPVPILADYLVQPASASARPTPRGSCTATSSRRTCSSRSAPTARRSSRSSTSGSRRLRPTPTFTSRAPPR